MFPVEGGKCLWSNRVHNCVEKFSQRPSKFAVDAQSGLPVEIVTEAIVQWVQLIRADRRVTIDSIATALWCSHGLACVIVHDRLKFRKVCARWLPRGLKDQKKLTERVCPCNFSYGMQMEETICLTGLLLRKNHARITTNQNQRVLQ
jgi:hypothetical protein